MEQWCEQVFYSPGQSPTENAGIILSAGVHGDELGPIQLLTGLLTAIRQGTLAPFPPLLLILANPQAIQCQSRFVEHNLNRLFQPSYSLKEHALPECAEIRRAQELMAACSRFADQCAGVACHLDLHSTIKPSLIERFALTPVYQQRYRLPWSRALLQAGFGAIVRQTQRANTFAQFSHQQLGAESFTLECGSHRQQPHNSHQGHRSALKHFGLWLTALLQYRGELEQALVQAAAELPPEPQQHQGQNLAQFVVAEEIIKRSTAFQFLIPEQEPNFSPHAAGTALYQDSNPGQDFAPTIWQTPGQRYSLFLNSGVAIGQRAGLLLQRGDVFDGVAI
jgi:succinylglutamate desuccinylase